MKKLSHVARLQSSNHSYFTSIKRECTTAKFWISSDIYFRSLNPPSSLKDELKSFEHNTPLKQNIFPCCEVEKVTPWVLLHLFYIHRIRLSASLCIELIEWTRSYPDLEKKYLKFMYTNLVYRHDLNVRVICTMIELMTLTKDTSSIQWISNRTILATDMTHDHVKAKRYSQSVALINCVLSAVQSVQIQNFSNVFVDCVIQKILSNKIYLENSPIICSLIIIFHQLRDFETSEGWLHWHFQHINHNLDNKKIWKLYPKIRWEKFFSCDDPAFIDWSHNVSIITAIVSGHLAIDSTHYARNTVIRALYRLAELSSVKCPLDIGILIKIFRLSRSTFTKSMLQVEDFLHCQSYSFLKVLCDHKEYSSAVRYLKSTCPSNFSRSLCAEVLTMPKCGESMRRYLFSQLHVKSGEDPFCIYRSYNQIVNRYIEHHEGSSTVHALQFLEGLSRGFFREHFLKNKKNEVNKCAGSPIHFDESFVDILYDQMDRCITSTEADELLSYITQAHPLIDEVLLRTIFQPMKYNALVSSSYVVNFAQLFSSLAGTASSIGQYDHIYVLDASLVECFDSLSSFLLENSLQHNKRILVAIPFVSLREACLSLLDVFKDGYDLEESGVTLPVSVNRILLSLSGGSYIHLKQDESHEFTSIIHVRLIHPTEELLLRKMRCPVTDFILANSLLNEKRCLHDDDDRVIFIAQALRALLHAFSQEKSAQTVQILTLDQALMNRCRKEKMPAIQLKADLWEATDLITKDSTEYQGREPFFDEKHGEKKTGYSPRFNQTNYARATIPRTIRKEFIDYFSSRKNSYRTKQRLRKTIGKIPAWDVDVERINVRNPAHKKYFSEYMNKKSRASLKKLECGT